MIRRVIIALAVAALALGVTSGMASAKSAEQVVFSIAPTFNPSLGPLGFWIWCQPEGNGPYVGECAGTIYFYGTTKVEQVADHATIAETPPDSGIYTITISTSDISCTLTNETPSPHGSGQNIDVSCTSPFSGSATVTGVVNVTGG